jgi:hypothetical protein
MKPIKFILLSFISLAFLASCENEVLDDLRENINPPVEELPALTAGNADFSNYVALGASFTAGFTDNGLFIAGQENSFPKTIADRFALAGGGAFTQPLMNDNFGGLALAGNRITDPRLVFGGAGPVPLESVIGPVEVTTDIATNNPTGPFNNLGVPGAKSFHLLASGYGNIANFPSAANPYAVRMTGDNPNASILELAIAQNPTFFTLSEIGGNDVLGYAISGGNGSDPLTDPAVFDQSLGLIVNGLVSTGADGAIANIPDITSLSYFTTVPHDPLDPSDDSFGPLIPTLNTVYGALNQVYLFLQSQGAINDAEVRSVVFSQDMANPIVIVDENLVDLSAQITQVLAASPDFAALLALFGLPPEAAPQVAALFGQFYGQSRPATEADLVTLPAASLIGQVDTQIAAFLESQGLTPELAAQFSARGVTLPMEDTFVLLPEEQQEIANALFAYNSSISALANANNLALIDLNSLLIEASTVGVQFDEYFMNTDLVFGGLVSLDGIHLTARGYALMANAFLEAIDEQYGSNFKPSGNLAKAGDFPTNFAPNLE